MITIKTLSLLLILLCFGCVPYLHYETKVSQVTGLVTRDGTPLSGATLRLSEKYHWSCNESVVSVSTTDLQGRFELKGKELFRLTRTVLGDPYYTNQLCIITEQGIFLGFLTGGVGHPPESLSVLCSINADSKPMEEKMPIAEARKSAVCTTNK